MSKAKEDAPTHVRDLRPDHKNARSHNPRNVGTIVDSLHAVGAARSIVIDETGRILAGNATVEAAGEAGITKVLTVDADGQTLVAVRRTGLSEEQKVRLALADNRASELATWDADVLRSLADEVKLDGLWSEGELAVLLSMPIEPEPPEDFPDKGEDIETEHACPKCGYRWSGGK